MISSFTRKLGNLDANHASEVFELDSTNALAAYVRVGVFDEDLEGNN